MLSGVFVCVCVFVRVCVCVCVCVCAELLLKKGEGLSVEKKSSSKHHGPLTQRLIAVSSIPLL